MNWDQYRASYHGFLASLAQARLITKVGQLVFDEFPRKLPQDVRDSLQSGLRQISQLIHCATEGIPESSASAIESSSSSPDNTADPKSIVFSTLEVMIYELKLASSSRTRSSRKKSLINLPAVSRLASSQELVMIMAHLDAFTGQSIRAICNQRPEVLKTSQQLTWSDVIGCKTWDGILTHLVEQFVYATGWKSFNECLELLSKRFGITIKLSARERKVLTRAELIRHLLVHNGGRISGEYVKRTGASAGKVGHQIYFPDSFVEEACEYAKWYGRSLFRAVSCKFFGIPAGQVDAETIISKAGSRKSDLKAIR